MTATAAINGGYRPVGEDDAIPCFTHRKLVASAQAGRGQFVTVSPATGLAALNDGTVPGQVSAGTADVSNLSDTDTGSGTAMVRLSQRWIKGLPASTVSLDGFADTDYAVPFWIANENTPGKLSNSAGSNRSMGGLVFGLADDGNPILWDGPVAWLLARGAHVADNESAGNVGYPVDASATTDVGSTTVATAALIMPRSKRHGVITSIEIIPSAALAATSGNDRTITIWKLDSLGVAAAVSVGTFKTTTALVAQTVAPFTLSAVAGALNLLETDILAYSTVHASAGAVIPQSAIRANMKVN